MICRQLLLIEQTRGPPEGFDQENLALEFKSQTLQNWRGHRIALKIVQAKTRPEQSEGERASRPSSFFRTRLAISGEIVRSDGAIQMAGSRSSRRYRHEAILVPDVYNGSFH